MAWAGVAEFEALPSGKQSSGSFACLHPLCNQHFRHNITTQRAMSTLLCRLWLLHLTIDCSFLNHGRGFSVLSARGNKSMLCLQIVCAVSSHSLIHALASSALHFSLWLRCGRQLFEWSRNVGIANGATSTTYLHCSEPVGCPVHAWCTE